MQRSWSQRFHQLNQIGINKDDQAVRQGEEVGHPGGVLCVAVLGGDLVVGRDQGAAAVGVAHVGGWSCKEVVVVNREGCSRVAEEVVKDEDK